MRQILLALVCLSTFAAAQNVLAVVPVAASPSLASLRAAEPSLAVDFIAAGSSSPEEGAPAGMMALMVAGLTGLTIAGARRHDRASRSA